MKPIILITAFCAIFTEANSQWSLTGNTGTNPATNFIGTTDSKSLKFRTNNVTRMNITSGGKIAIGNFTPAFRLDVKGGSINTDSVYRIGGITVLSVKGNANTFTGTYSGFSYTTGEWNTGNGASALYSNTTGSFNTATGVNALFYNTLGHSNTANGVNALLYNSTGIYNTANGRDALYSNTTGFNNTATGYGALLYNSTGTYNTATGMNALFANTTGFNNIANGYSALYSNTTGDNNIANGVTSLYNNTFGYNNIANGSGALYANTIGTNNNAHGVYALGNTTTGSYNTANGGSAHYYNTTGSYNTAIGYIAGCSPGQNPSNFTALGYNAGHVAGMSNEMEIGNTSVSWTGGNVNWGTYSDKRIKDNIQSNVPGLSFINKLNPVTYNLNIHRQNEMCGINDTNEWEGKYDIEKIIQTGFLAQEVEQAALECNYNFNGVKAPHGNAKLYSVQYASFVVPLVKAVQELNEKNQKSEIRSEKLEEEIENLKSEIRNMKSGMIQSASAKGGLQPEMLFQNSPNPFSEKTVVRFNIPSSSQTAEIKIYSIEGKELKSFIISIKGESQIEIDANTFSSGLYNYSLFIDGKAIDSKQMVLTK